jgi:2-C-methyl-D-erythritol 4-phosphate cytidylyltransferase
VALAVIAAGGSGDRFGGPVAKFEAPLLGKPIVRYSLDAFQQSAAVSGIVLVVPADRVEEWDAATLRSSGLTKVLATVAGGATRQESVFLGLQVISSEAGVVVVHDAARPMVTATMVDAVCEVPAGMSGGTTAVPVTDTVKEVEGRMVVSTLDRSRLVSVQTPQAFIIADLIEAHRDAARAGFAGTDDASLVERMGGRVGIIEGSRDNIKVTHESDLRLAEAILKGRGT